MDEHEDAAHAIAAARTETGRRRSREVMVSDAPPPISPSCGTDPASPAVTGAG